MDKQPSSYHHWNIIQKHNLMTFDSLVFLADVSLVYKVINDLAAPPLNEFVSLCSGTGRRTRTTNRGDCAVQNRSTESGRSVFSVRDTKYYNSVPREIREWNNFDGFKLKIKSWLKSTQSCSHQSSTQTANLYVVKSCCSGV